MIPQQRCIPGGSRVQLLLACPPCLLPLLFFWWGQGLYTFFDYPLYLCSSAKFILEVSPSLFFFFCRLSSLKSSNVQVSGVCFCMCVYILLSSLEVPPPPSFGFLKTLLLVWAPTSDTQTCCDPSSSATPLQFCRSTIRGCRLFNFNLPCFVCFTSAILSSRRRPST